MGLSETIIAAIIGAIATVATAIVQIVKSNSSAESGRPKKSRTRSTFAIIALVLGAMFGGYFWSELRAVGAREEIAALRADLRLAMRNEASRQAGDTLSAADPGAPHPALAARVGTTASAESVAHLPPCRVTPQAEEAGPATCDESLATVVAVCAIVPSGALTQAVRIHARVPMSEEPWLERDAGAPTLGSLHIAPSPSEYPAGADRRAVCMDVSNWSVEQTFAVRLTVDYAFAPPPATELTAAAPTGHSL